MRVLSLFSGIGGLDLAAEWAGMTTVAFCERDKYCQKVLAKHWPGVPIFDDVTTLKGDQVGTVDLITGGYPCQPFSVAGKRRGADDERYLWPEFSRLIDECRPAWVVGENVAGHVTKGLDAVCDDLEGKGYTVQAFVFPASAVGATHERNRCFIVANTDAPGLQERFVQPGVPGKTRRYDDGENASLGTWWQARPNVVRGLHGVPGRVDRIAALGNAVVPQQAYPIFKAIAEVSLV